MKTHCDTILPNEVAAAVPDEIFPANERQSHSIEANIDTPAVLWSMRQEERDIHQQWCRRLRAALSG
jgi:hypothetical protein